MAQLTRLQIKEYTRSITGVLDSDRINNSTLDADINLSQRKIQLDLLGLGVKRFTKIAYNSGYRFDLPTDMLFHPNAIIDLQGATGTKDTFAFQFSLNGIVVTMIEAGISGFTLNIRSGGTALTPMYIDHTLTTETSMTIRIRDGVSTVAQLLAFFLSDPILRNTFTAESSTTGAITLVENPAVGLFADGTGAGYKYIEEKSITEFNRIKGRTFSQGTELEPVYRRVGDATPNQTVEIYPISVKYSKIFYYYRLADLTADTDVSGLPIEMEELLLTDLQRRVYIYLKKQTEDKMAQIDYQNQINDATKKYDDSLMALVVDKKRIGSTEGS
jgi:hypothetical protein